MYLSSQEVDMMYVELDGLTHRETRKALKSTKSLDLHERLVQLYKDKVRHRPIITKYHTALPPYLDLATERGTPENPVFHMSCDELVRAVSAFIQVPNGEEKTVEKAVLRAMGASSGMFVLFPNLSQELKDRIITMSIPWRFIRADLVHDPITGTDSFRFIGNRRPIFCASSKIACTSVVPTIYKPLLPITGRNILINRELDILVLDTNSQSANLASVSVALAPNSPLLGIQSLAMNVQVFARCLKWAEINLSVLKGLRLFILQDHVIVSDHRLAAIHSLAFVKEGTGYRPTFRSGSTVYSGNVAMREFGNNVPDVLGLSATDVKERLEKLLAGVPMPELVLLEIFCIFRT